MGDLLGEDIALVQPNNLYRCLDKLTVHKQAMFTFPGRALEGAVSGRFRGAVV